MRKEIEVKERDIATLKIRSRQEVDRHAEELTVMIRDRDALQKHCNNLTRRQIQYQHEIRRKELQYEWLQEKLRNYLAERKRESSASMEIVGLLRQQTPQQQQQRDKHKIVSRIDDLMPGRNGNPKKSSSRGPKLDETMVKMIVTAYEEKQKELMAENDDLQEALNSIRKEYTDLMNAQLKAEMSSRALARMDSKILTTKLDSLESHSTSEETRISPVAHGPTKSGIASCSQPAEGSSSASKPGDPISCFSSRPRAFNLTEQPEYQGSAQEDVCRMAELPDAVLNAAHPDLVPWPINHDVQLKATVFAEGAEEKEGPSILDTAERTPLLPTVVEEHEASSSVHVTPRDVSEKADPEPIDGDILAEQTDLVLASLSASDVKADVKEEHDASASAPESQTTENKSTRPRKGGAETPDEKVSGTKTVKKSGFVDTSSPESGSPAVERTRSQKFSWPPPSPSPQPREEASPRRLRPALGKLPQPSNKPVPNAALLSEEQLKVELRTRAVDVEEAVRALKTACTSMQPQHMRSVMEKRLHMELTMAANLAEQQEAVVNLALAGLERVRRTAPGTEADLETMSSSLNTSLDKSEVLISKMKEIVSGGDSNADSLLRQNLEEITMEFQQLREKTARPTGSSPKNAPLSATSSRDLDKDISSLRERADGLTKEKEMINKACGELQSNDAAPSRLTWAEKAKQEKVGGEEETLSVDSYSDDDAAPTETLSRILHSAE